MTADEGLKLELNIILNQIYQNGNVYDGPFITLSFDTTIFLFLNGVYIYPRDKMDVMLGSTTLSIRMNSTFIEIEYEDIDDFLIQNKEA